jgi:Flp pilus assembly protein TadG
MRRTNQRGRPASPPAPPAPAPSLPRRGREGGNELLEFALLLPGLLLLLCLGGEAAGMVATHQILNNAVREGARLAVVPGELGHASDVTGRVTAYAAANGVSVPASDVQLNQAVVLSTGGGCSATQPCIQASRVSVSYPYAFEYLPALPFGLPTSVTLDASVTMRNQY